MANIDNIPEAKKPETPEEERQQALIRMIAREVQRIAWKYQ